MFYNFKIAKFAFANPSGTLKPKAVLVLVPPSNSDGRRMIEYPDWVKFALEHELILLGCFFQDEHPSGIELYCHMDSGSGLALASEWFEYAVEHKFDSETQFLMWGFSAGGQFNYEFACAYPSMVKGFVVNKGGIYYTALASPEARKVPGLFIVGDRDTMWRRNILMGIYSVNEACGANWDFMGEDCAHSVCDSETIGMEFFTHLLEEE